MAYKYKLKEIEVGDTKVTGGVKSVVTDIDPETGAITWSVDYIPNIDKLVEDAMELAKTARGVYQKAKDDKKFLDIYEQAKQLRNVIRTHVRNNYPEDYKKIKINELDLSHHMELGNDWGEVIFYLEKYGTDEEIDAYITAFKEQAGPYFDDSNFDHVKEFQKWVKTAMRTDEISTSGGAGAYNTPYAFKLVKKQEKIIPEGVGATLGPGPKAGPEGVKDNAYVKQFKYKLVPKNKDGTYVQKGSGLNVKNLF